MPNPAHPELNFRADLQGLRALAVAMVVLAHASVPGFSGGFVGVDLFFVLSGYLITGILYQELQQTGRIDLPVFYSRRIKRLLPAMMLMIGATLAAVFILLPKDEAKLLIGSAPFASLWLSNFYFNLNDAGYFDEQALEDLFLHTWSLGVEEQFYLTWPCLMLLLGWLQHRNSGKDRIGANGRIIAGFAAIGMTSLALCVYWLGTSPLFSFYQMPSRAWQFTLGALVFLVWQRRKVLLGETVGGQASGYVLLLAGLVLIGISVGFYHDQMAYPGWAAVMPSVGAVLIIAAGILLHSWHNPLAWPPLVWLGNRSYSVYLWHWPILQLTKTVHGGHTATTITLAIAGSLLLAELTYRLIEQPFWKGKFSHYASKVVLQSGLVAMLLTMAACFHAARKPIDPNMLTGNQATQALKIDAPVIYTMPCDSWYENADIQPCTFGPENASNTALLLVDSIGAQWFSLIADTYLKQNWKVVVLTKSACPIVDEPIFYSRINHEYSICEQWRNKILDQLEEWSPDVVITGSTAGYEYTHEQWVSGSQRVWRKITDTGARVIVIPGTPSLGMDGPSCLRRQLEAGHTNYLDMKNTCSKDQANHVAYKIADLLKTASANIQEVDVLDLNAEVCPEKVCSAITGAGIVVFRDGQHLTDSFVRSLAINAAPKLIELSAKDRSN